MPPSRRRGGASCFRHHFCRPCSKQQIGFARRATFPNQPSRDYAIDMLKHGADLAFSAGRDAGRASVLQFRLALGRLAVVPRRYRSANCRRACPDGCCRRSISRSTHGRCAGQNLPVPLAVRGAPPPGPAHIAILRCGGGRSGARGQSRADAVAVTAGLHLAAAWLTAHLPQLRHDVVGRGRVITCRRSLLLAGGWIPGLLPQPTSSGGRTRRRTAPMDRVRAALSSLMTGGVQGARERGLNFLFVVAALLTLSCRRGPVVHPRGDR